MIKKYIAIILSVIAVFTLFAACGNKVPSENETDPQKVQAEGYDILGGTWYVGAVYYKNKIVDISDNSALEDLYDAVFLAFREDGTFTFSNYYMRDGVYTPIETDGGSKQFLLKTQRVYNYEFVDGVMTEKEKEDSKKTSYLVTILDEKDSFRFVEMDPVTGKAKADEDPWIFELANRDSEYISNNKIEIGDSTTAKADRKPATTKPATTKSSGGYITSGQRNALSSAKSYLSVMAFSYEGLIEQLEYEGYSNSEAKYAADNCGADWYEQAVRVTSIIRTRLKE